MIVRNNRKRQFTAVDTSIARNRTFRPDELGLYTAMLAHTDDWEFSIGGLQRETDADRNEIRDILLRLEQKGFVRRRRNSYGTVWDLIEAPGGTENGITNRTAAEQTQAPAQNGRELTHEEIGRMLIEKAEELRKYASKQKMQRIASCGTDADRV